VKVNCGNHVSDTYLPVWWICDATCTKLLNRLRRVRHDNRSISDFKQKLSVWQVSVRPNYEKRTWCAV